MPAIDGEDLWQKIAKVGGGITLVILLVSCVWLLIKENYPLAIALFTGGCYLELVHIRYIIRDHLDV